MIESKLEEIIIDELESVGYDPVQQPKVYLEGVYLNGDIKIKETDTIIELKGDQGDIRKAIGQSLSYEAAGHNSAIITEDFSHRDVKTIENISCLKMPFVHVELSQFLGVHEIEFNPIVNEREYVDLFERLVYPDRFNVDEMTEEYRKHAPDIEWR